MKKLVLMFIALFSMSASVFADGLTATLQQGDNMQAFFGQDALKQAYEAAQSNGAIITLSEGTFNPVESVEKSMTIIGYSGFESSKTYIANMKILADNVKIEGIYFGGNVELGRISNCHIKRCYLNSKLTSTETHTNTFVDQCVVKCDYAIGTGANYVIKNSTLYAFYAMNTVDNKAQITNCVIWRYFSSYSSDSQLKQPYAIYMNNVLGVYNYSSSGTTVTCNANSEFYYNYFVRTSVNDNSPYRISVSYSTGCINQGNWYISSGSTGRFYSESYPANQTWNDKKGMDGTIVGINGGSGFTQTPSIPRITSNSISNYADSQGKINVKISATIGSN